MLGRLVPEFSAAPIMPVPTVPPSPLVELPAAGPAPPTPPWRGGPHAFTRAVQGPTPVARGLSR